MDRGQWTAVDTLFFLFNITIEANCTINALLNKNPVIILAESILVRALTPNLDDMISYPFR